MKYLLRGLFAVLFIGLNGPSYSQEPVKRILDSLFKDRSEVCFTFKVTDREDVHALTRLISIDNVKGKTVFAYANRKEFADFLRYDFDYKILPQPGKLLNKSELESPAGRDAPADRTTWDFYQ